MILISPAPYYANLKPALCDDLTVLGIQQDGSWEYALESQLLAQLVGGAVLFAGVDDNGEAWMLGADTPEDAQVDEVSGESVDGVDEHVWTCQRGRGGRWAWRKGPNRQHPRRSF